MSALVGMEVRKGSMEKAHLRWALKVGFHDVVRRPDGVHSIEKGGHVPRQSGRECDV